MLRFLHAADLHLDSPLRSLQRYPGAPVERLHAATRSALDGLVQQAILHRVDFVLIAGDLYDGPWRDHHTGLFFASRIQQLRDASIPVFMIAGNHDAASRITGGLPLPRNAGDQPILLSSDRVERVTLDDLGVVIHGRGFGSSAEQNNLVDDYPSAIRGLWNIGLLHTSLTGSARHDAYAPCTPNQLSAKQYDYWALGHIHQRGMHHRDGESPIVFPGNTQGRDMGECGAKGCYLVEFPALGQPPQLTFLPLDSIRWHRAAIDALGIEDDEGLLQQIADQVTTLLQAADRGDRPLIVRFTIQGANANHAAWVANQSKLELAARQTIIDVSQGSVWLERLPFHTEPLSVVSEPIDDGPVAVLRQWFDELREHRDELVGKPKPSRSKSQQPLLDATTTAASLDPMIRQRLLEPLIELRRKLTDDVTSGEDGIPIDDPQWIAQRLDEVEAVLMHRLGSL
jgi:DNA repair protein SbcD/Mre11